MRWFVAGLAFFVMFAMVFFLAGLFLMPHLPPVPPRPVSVFEGAYWTDNWIGVVLGLGAGIYSAWKSFQSAGKSRGDKVADD